MKILNKEEFLSKKKHDTLAIMGSGYSINKIINQQWDFIYENCDQFGMNWYCNSKKDTTFYMVREQCVAPGKLEKGSMPEDLYHLINAIDTTLIVKKNHGKADNYFHIDHLDKFDKEGIIVEDIVGKCKSDVFTEDIFETGLRHGKGSIWDALHFSVFMKYENVLFCGIDLNDTRYFWLPYNKTREIVANESKTCTMPHNQMANTIDIVKNYMRQYPDKRLQVMNPHSALAGIVEVFNGSF